jgi:MoaA/NifB/PqqE/SkfB family radical SAM enzyme
MRTERVTTNLSCNQNCSYCNSRASRDDRGFVAPAAVLARLDAALAGGPTEIVLTGGEPTLRRDLPRLVAEAKARGAVRVVLETNATAIDGGLAQALRAAGLDRARVNVAAWGDALDAITRDPGGFGATRRGLRALADAGVELEIAVALVRANASLVAALPAALVRELGEGAIRALVVSVPVSAPAEAGARETLDYAEAAARIAELDAAARAVALPVRLNAESGPPPCVFPARARPTHLYALTRLPRRRADWALVDACEGCRVVEQCAGFPKAYLAAHALPALAPITEDRVRRRLSVISSIEEQIEREFVTKNRLEHEGRTIDEELIRVNFHCNQACRFCFVSTHLPAPGDDAVRAAIESAGARGVKITLSGGEPTLNPRLAEYIRLARAKSSLPVLLQTNAVRLDDLALARSLVEAGLQQAFVSMHGSRPETGDAITGAPGTFVRTLVGVDHLHALGVSLDLNFVLCETNYTELPEFVRTVGARWPNALANVSFVAPSTDVVPRDREFIPRYADVLPYLEEAIAEAARLGVGIAGFDSMCGIPLCLVPASLEPFFAKAALLEGFDQGEFVKTDACRACELSSRCYGLRRGYLELHGASELKPVTRAARG